MQFDAARAKLEEAATQDCIRSARRFSGAWFMPNDPLASVHTHLALARYMQGDITGAEEAFSHSRHAGATRSVCRRARSARSYARQSEALTKIESGDFGHAAELHRMS